MDELTDPEHNVMDVEEIHEKKTMDIENNKDLDDIFSILRINKNLPFTEDYYNTIIKMINFKNHGDYQFAINAIKNNLDHSDKMKNDLTIRRKCYSEKLNHILEKIKIILAEHDIISFPISIDIEKNNVKDINNEDFDIYDQVKLAISQPKNKRRPLDLGYAEELSEKILENMTVHFHHEDNACNKIDRSPRVDNMNNLIKNDRFFFLRIVKKRKQLSFKKMKEFIKKKTAYSIFLEFKQQINDEGDVEEIKSFFNFLKKQYDDDLESELDIKLSKYDIRETKLNKNPTTNFNMEIYKEIAPMVDAIFILKKKMELLNRTEDNIKNKLFNLPLDSDNVMLLTNQEFQQPEAITKFINKIEGEYHDLIKYITLKNISEALVIAFLKKSQTESLILPHQIDYDDWSIKLDVNYSYPTLNDNFILNTINEIRTQFNLPFSETGINQIMEKFLEIVPNMKKADAIKKYKFVLVKESTRAHIKYNNPK